MNEKECWQCGKLTEGGHHVIPKGLNPKKNQTIPMCKDCHETLHGESNNGVIPRPRREIVYFYEHKKGNKEKIQGSISNGKIIFPDRSCEGIIKPNKYYDVEVFQISNTAFARSPRRVWVFGMGRSKMGRGT